MILFKRFHDAAQRDSVYPVVSYSLQTAIYVWVHIEQVTKKDVLGVDGIWHLHAVGTRGIDPFLSCKACSST
jgi:hypothetical protein